MAKVILEVWKDIPGYEGLYQVSNMGNVKSLFRYKKQLKPMMTNSGYLQINLFKNKIRKVFLVHRLVAIVFLDNPQNKEEVNHIDECKTNNKLSNLEWVTRTENSYHGTRIERQKKHTDYKNRKVNNRNQIKACSKPIAQYDKNGNFIKTWNSASEFCRENGKTSISSIRRCCNGERKSAYGYIFKNIEKE